MNKMPAMGLSHDEVAAILRLKDTAERVMNANWSAVAAALAAADQMREIVSAPSVHRLRAIHGQYPPGPRELRAANERIQSLFGVEYLRTLADAFVGERLIDAEQFSGGVSTQLVEQFKLLNSSVDHLAGLKALMPPDQLSATIAKSLVSDAAAQEALQRASNFFESCEIPDYANELRQFSAMSIESQRLLDSLDVQHGFVDLLGVHVFTRSLVEHETGRLNRAYAGFGASIARQPERLTTGREALGAAPADAVFSQSRVVRVVTTHAEIHEESAADEIWSDVRDRTLRYIEAVLPELSPRLMKSWEGVWDTARRRGPDWARQAAASLRFILVEVLDTVAPVNALTDIPKHYVHNGKLGRPAQIYWLCVPLQNRTYRRVARADLESATSIIDAMSEAVHRDDYVEIEDAFDTLAVRAGVALCNLLKLWRARN